MKKIKNFFHQNMQKLFDTDILNVLSESYITNEQKLSCSTLIEGLLKIFNLDGVDISTYEDEDDDKVIYRIRKHRSSLDFRFEK
jgi:hypothetical protein